MKLNLGCGQDIEGDGWLNVDALNLPGVDVVHNLVQLPYPFGDETAEHIKAVDVLEHLPNYTPDWKPMIPAFIEELWRILEPEGTAFIQAPGWDAEFLHIDPTHVRGFHLQSLDFFDPDTHFGKTTGFYSPAKFHVEATKLANCNLQWHLTKRNM